MCKLYLHVSLLLFPAALLVADTIHVPGDYAMIQEAIDAAVNGDSVLVAPGTYEENIDYKGKAIVVQGTGGAWETVIDGGQSFAVVSFMSAEGMGSVLEGFTITNGKYTYGAGILCWGASPTIRHNRIMLNEATGDGGGIACRAGADALIVENHILSNRSLFGRGGGICCDESSPAIIRNKIENNELDGDRGAGIYVCYAAPTITENRIADNHTKVRGGGIYLYESNPQITRNMVTGNSADYYGGGIYCFSQSHAYIHCNVIANNTVQQEGGGGIICSGSSNAKIINNTITGNTACTVGGGIWSTSTPVVSNNIIWDNSAREDPEIYTNTTKATYCLVKGGWPGTGNIDADPLFVDPVDGDFHLAYPSPCRDMGDNSAVTELTDFENDPRIAWGGAVDMGADEFYTHLYVTGATTPGGSIQGKFIGLPGSTPVGLFIGSDVHPSLMPTLWGEFWLQAPWVLYGPLGAIPSDGVMVLPTTLPGSIPAPYDVPMQALIGLSADSLSNLCVLQVR